MRVKKYSGPMLSDEWNDWVFSEIIKEQKLKYYNFKNKKEIFKDKKEYKTKNFFGLNTNNNFFLINLNYQNIKKFNLIFY